MPWMQKKLSQQRLELISLARQPGANHTQLCARFGVSRKTLYKWLGRASAEPHLVELEDRSRRPQKSPRRTSRKIEQQVLKLRAEEPAWGPRKLEAPAGGSWRQEAAGPLDRGHDPAAGRSD